MLQGDFINARTLAALLSTATLALAAGSAWTATIVVTNQAEFDAAIAVATEPGHTDTIDATNAGTIDAGTSLTLPAAATSINLEFVSLALGATASDETATFNAGTTVSFGEPGNPGLFNMGWGYLGTLNINGASLIFNVTDAVAQFNVGLDGGNGIVNMTSGAVTMNTANAGSGQYGALSIGYPFGSTQANGTFNQSGGTVSLSSGALNVGIANGIGTYNLTGTALLESLGATDYIGSSTGGIGNVNISGNATFDFESAGFGGQLYVGDNLGVGTFTQNGANSTVILNVINIADFGSNVLDQAGGGGTGIYNLMAGTLEIGGHGADFGVATGGTGLLNQSGGVFTASAPIYIGMSGSGTYNLSGGVATLDAGLSIAVYAGSIGTVNQTGGVLTIAGGQLIVGGAGAATYNLDGGTLQVGGVDGIIGTGALNLGGGTLQVFGSGLTTNIAMELTADTASTVDTNGLGATFGGVLSGAGALTKVGAGTLMLTGVNAYTGGTTIDGGLVQAGNNSAVGTGAVALDGGGFQAGADGLAFGNGFALGARANTIDTQTYSLSLSGVVSGAGGFTKQGSGTLTLTGVNTYTGGTTVDGGLVQAGDNSAVGTGAVALDGGGFQAGANGLAFGNGFALGAAANTVDTQTFALSLSGALSGAGGFSKQGSGTLTLSGSSTYLGATLVDAGTLRAGATGAFAPVGAFIVASGATLDLDNFNETIGSLAGGGAVTLGTATLTAGGDDTGTTFSGAISGAGGLTKQGAGVLMLSGSNTYAGATLIDAGTLRAGAAGTFAPTGAFTVASGATLDLNGFNQTIGSLAGGGGVKLGSAILTAGGDATSTNFSGDISGAGGFTKQGAGALTLSGSSTYAGATRIDAGTLRAGATDAFAPTSAFTVASGATLDLNGFNQTIGSLAGGGAVTVGTAAPAGSGGDTRASLSAAAALGTATPETATLGTATLTAGGDDTSTTFSGAISGAGGLTKQGAGVLTLSGSSSYGGATLVDAGALRAGAAGAFAPSSAFTVAPGATLDLNGFNQTIGSLAGGGVVTLGSAILTAGGDATGTIFSGDVSGAGGLTKTGAGTLTLSGANVYTGPTMVDGGILDVSGSLASTVTVNSGGLLEGDGSVGAVNVASGAAVAAGSSIGKLSINGNVSFAAGSTYQVEVNEAGQSGKIAATGTATLSGGTVQVLAAPGVYAVPTKYTILTAAAVTGTFADVTSQAFLTPSLSYGADDVVLTLSRNNTDFAGAALTPNQRAAGEALNLSLSNSALVQAVLPLTAPETVQALGELSGDIHAGIETELFDDSRYVRASMLGRMRQASFADIGGPLGALSAGGPSLAYADPQPGSTGGAAAAPARDTVWWGQAVGAWGRIASDGNAAAVDRDLGGVFSGVDTRLGDNWRAGVATGYTYSSLSSDARASSAYIDTYHVAAYGQGLYGSWRLRSGADFGWNEIASDRTVDFPGVANHLTAHYDAAVAQLFGELGYGIAFGNVAAEPFAGLAWVHSNINGFSETGGVAALTGSSTSANVGYSTLGARLASGYPLTNGMTLTPRASVAWQRAVGDVTAATSVGFQSTGVGFRVYGAPLALNAAVVEAGLDLAVTRLATIGIAYSGLLANSAKDQSVNADLSWRF